MSNHLFNQVDNWDARFKFASNLQCGHAFAQISYKSRIGRITIFWQKPTLTKTKKFICKQLFNFSTFKFLNFHCCAICEISI